MVVYQSLFFFLGNLYLNYNFFQVPILIFYNIIIVRCRKLNFKMREYFYIPPKVLLLIEYHIILLHVLTSSDILTLCDLCIFFISISLNYFNHLFPIIFYSNMLYYLSCLFVLVSEFGLHKHYF